MIYISKDTILSIEYDLDKNKNIETGGILLGVYCQSNDILITHAFDAGPKAKKCKFYFMKDYDYSRKIQDKYFKKYSVDYIGEWHKHPNNNTNYSFLDYLSILKISFINVKPCIFIIVGEDFSQNNSGQFINIYTVNKHKGTIVSNDYKIIEKPEIIAIQKGLLSINQLPYTF